MKVRLLNGLIAIVAVSAFGLADAVEQDLQTQTLCLVAAETVKIKAELATEPKSRERGLMERESLPAESGMLFVYPQNGMRAFWMYKTRIPLDIAYIGSNGRIQEIYSMEPCRSIFPARCPNYPSQQPLRMALEVNQGKFAEWGVEIGDMVFTDDCETPLQPLPAT
ncbi:MAG: DUF192 domain-containing protein [Aliidiomarina sp.]|uniref:DUF192 domain-containing protein n=1 Tax=Aliidiomarina sp. TaxID=1872439 RepID=UPI0025B8E576|nr:DUF192 domain-containing protein [Aliidiomarina sp.]MCH8501813.1 DUF192 domain-containing protein [Aliidiomarina sp.]